MTISHSVFVGTSSELPPLLGATSQWVWPQEYWDLRYKVDQEPFEWLRSYQDLEPFLSCDKSAGLLASIWGLLPR